MHNLLPSVNASMLRSSADVLELAVERWVILNAITLPLVYLRIRRVNASAWFMLLLFAAPITAAVTLLIRPSFVVGGTRFPAFGVGGFVLQLSFGTAVATA